MSKRTVWIDTDERWPDHILETESRGFGDPVEVDEVTLAHWQAAIAAYNEVQREMSAALEEAGA